MSIRRTILVLCVAGLAGCGSASDTAAPSASPTPDAAGVLTITTAKSAYAWQELSFAGGGLVATVVNPGPRDYFANIGDRFNGSLDQAQVFIAEGTDAALEVRTSDGSWSPVPTGVLVEGSRVVAIRAGGRYELRGSLPEPRRTGTMRVRLRYYTSQAATGQPMTDYSATFTVR